jgi:glycosyltransferase involved in cell wall biosynthesis
MSDSKTSHKADIGLFIEGSYPYVRGGVSVWVHNYLKQFSDLKFALIFIGAQKSLATEKFFELPANVISCKELFLFDPLPEKDLTPSRKNSKIKREFFSFLARFFKATDIEAQIKLIWEFVDWFNINGEYLTFGNLLEDPEAWDVLTEVYERETANISFIDFFWTARFLTLPIWKLFRFMHEVPHADIYHSVLTGYAGALAAFSSQINKTPFIITEHGIYVKERILEITQSTWIHEERPPYFSYDIDWRKLKNLWIHKFQLLARIAYEKAHHITTLYEGNARLQCEFGAHREKISIIPNGMDLQRFDTVLDKRENKLSSKPDRKNIAFIGRIVTIKDVKTFLRSIPIVLETIPDAQFNLYGPTEEEKSYHKSCLQLIGSLGIREKVNFIENKQIEDILPEVDIMVLTSISEALPLVILEAFGAKIPVVATDVGACRELLYGKSPEDKKIGRAGLLTPIASPEDTAEALVTLLKQEHLRNQMGMVGRLRLERFYEQSKVTDQYRSIYKQVLGSE